MRQEEIIVLLQCKIWCSDQNAQKQKLIHSLCVISWLVLHHFPLLDIPEILMHAALKIVIPVALAVLRFSSGRLEFSPSECSCAVPMQHGNPFLQVRILNKGLHAYLSL